MLRACRRQRRLVFSPRHCERSEAIHFSVRQNAKARMSAAICGIDVTISFPDFRLSSRMSRPHAGYACLLPNWPSCEHFTPQRTSPDYPTGKSATNLSSTLAKNIPLAPSGKSSLQATPSHPNEGRIAIVTNARWDAVDADSAVDETRMRRTVKSCGPDAPTLASSRWSKLHRRWWQQSPVTRESSK
jgi:hypothetical protein